MKPYTQPVTETVEIQSADCFMELAEFSGHGQLPAPKKKVF